MPEQLRIVVEIAFNIAYLLVIWAMVLLMIRKWGRVEEGNRSVARLFIQAFALLALGDTGHVGFRVIAYANGGLESNLGLIGWGAFSTAMTVTVFYMLMLLIWKRRFQKPLGWYGWLFLAAGIIRLGFLLLPQNQWQALVPPYDWSLLRNGFLVVQGLGVMGLILRDSTRESDRTFKWIGWMVAVSYLFYLPVILWVQIIPLLGMLMIPKTCAYVAIALIGYRAWWAKARA